MSNNSIDYVVAESNNLLCILTKMSNKVFFINNFLQLRIWCWICRLHTSFVLLYALLVLCFFCRYEIYFVNFIRKCGKCIIYIFVLCWNSTIIFSLDSNICGGVKLHPLFITTYAHERSWPCLTWIRRFLIPVPC